MKSKRIYIILGIFLSIPGVVFADDGGWFSKLMEKFTGLTLEKAFEGSSSLITKWVLQTPYLINYEWIQKVWWFCFIISIIMLGVGAGISVVKLFAGWTAAGAVLTSILIAFVGSTLSLYGSDKLISGINFATNELVNGTLVTEYYRGENQKAILEEGLDEDDIGFDSFEGKALMKVSFGGNLTDEEELYKTFTGNGGGGIILMIWGMLVLFLIGLFGQIRYGIIGLLAGIAPFWFSSSAFTGDSRPAVGYINLFVRSVLLSGIFDIAWLFATYTNRSLEFADLGRQSISCLIYTIALVAAIWFWFRWVVKAAIKPATLAGGAVQKHYGKMGSKIGKAMEGVGARFGMETLEVKGGEIRATGEERSKIASEKRAGDFTGNTKDRLAQARNKYRYETYSKKAKQDIVKDFQYGSGGMVRKMDEVDTLGINENELVNMIRNKNLGSVVRTENGKVLVDQKAKHKVDSLIKDSYSSEHIQSKEFNGDKGYLLKGVDQHADELLALLKEENIKHKDINNVVVTKEVIKALEERVKEIEPFDNSKLQKLPEGKVSIKIENIKELEKAERMLSNNKVKFSNEGGYLMFDEQRYKNMLHKTDITRDLLKNKNNDGEIEYNFEYKFDDNKRKQLMDTLKDLDVSYKEKEILWVDEDSKDRVLDKIVTVEKTKRKREHKQYANLQLGKGQFYDDIYEEINKKYPEAILNKGSRNKNQGNIIIDNEYMEKIKDIVKDYENKTPYWKDSTGAYYYIDSKLKMVVKHLNPPGNGRYMGLYKE
ncbi:hypothetical protein [Sporosalibacterium faouarense]|uniref:hypothetical protein n=1 Tax=Sporosalibacterium faouarense TaxID=516123 RepID=UPI00192B9FDC|nr:hypothetical protein [Sporosalibacterium faouarense]